ncbi:response regulator [Sciscionella sediminilitoris]|uniref:response regulator n=1 Tax=Sciscionella sediminilitoris TaxID=1445613 RepID=UPI0004DFCBC0|nr:response regulator transcription factor [Sciscionella sp. SE31]
MTVRVLIADDQAIVRTGLRVLVDRDPELTVAGEAATGEEAVRTARTECPDVLLMDIRMPGKDGITATRELLAAPETAAVRIIVLTTFDTEENIFAALDAGASGFLLKDTDPAELRNAIHVVAAGEALLAPTVTRTLIDAYTSRRTPRLTGHTGHGLTEREGDVVRLVAAGLSNAEIAGALSISPTTAKTHVNRSMAKLGAHDRAQLVISAYRTGLADPP